MGIIVCLAVIKQLRDYRPKANKKRLVAKLEKAERVLAKYSGGYSGEHLSAEDFHVNLKSVIKDYKNGNKDSLDKLYIWFAPTGDWDDIVGLKGQRLGEHIFGMVDELRKDK